MIHDFPSEFVTLFDKNEQMHISEYIKQVHEKYGITYQEIIDKHTKDSAKFMEDFQKWKVMHSALA